VVVTSPIIYAGTGLRVKRGSPYHSLAINRKCMRKNQVWHSIASSIFAGIITYLLLELVKTELFPHMKATVVFVVGVASFFVAYFTGRDINAPPEENSKSTSVTEVGTSIKAKEDVEVSDVEINADSPEGLKVGSDIESEKSVKITGIKVSGK
jgi:hypothetical protein